MKLKLLLFVTIAAFTFSSCKTCCKVDGSGTVCKGDLDKDQWDDIVDSCQEQDDCSCW